jgi:UDP-4-amino-4,6-dideoxy-N-acetyl-beta-L-altrosamine N-acetyltransferase
MPNFISNIKLIRFKKFSHDIALSILEIRNQDHIRKNMINDQIIKFDDHINWLKNSIIEKKNIFYLIYIKNKVSGLVRFIIHKNKAEWSFYLDKNCKNVYGAYIEYLAIEKIFKNKKIDTLECQVLSFNSRILSLHEKFGFMITRVEKNILHRNNTNIDIFFLINDKKIWNTKRIEIKKKLKC